MRVLWYYCLAVPHLAVMSPLTTELLGAKPLYDTIQFEMLSGSSTLGPGGYRPPKSWLGPKFSRTVDTLWSIDSQFYPHDGAENQLA